MANNRSAMPFGPHAVHFALECKFRHHPVGVILVFAANVGGTESAVQIMTAA